MGTRIHKKLGYFLSNTQVKKLFVRNPASILENLDENPQSFQEQFLTSLQTVTDSKGKKDVYISSYLHKEYSNAFTKNQLKPYDLIFELFFYDTKKGIMIQTLEQHVENRHDNNLDYYENPMRNRLHFLNRSIYPLSGYIYQGGLEDKFPLLVKGENMRGVEASAILKTLGMETSDNIQKEANIIFKSGFFIPVIDPIIYLIAKASGLLKAEVTIAQFNSQIRPVISTYWG